MNGEIFNKIAGRRRILVAPLDWGLGHATRCIPIIKALAEQGCEVIIAAENNVETLLKAEFPELQFLPLRGYYMRYSRKALWLPFVLLWQFPKLFRTIRYERKWLKRTVEAFQIDAVISDNRFGLYHSSVPCIYITHQLMIETGNRLSRWLAQKMHYHFINKFTGCWVPDAEGKINLAGKLSHPQKLPLIPVQYIGPLSRFQKMELDKKYDLLICLSGPEPQRTIFENILLNDLKNYAGKALLARGLPGNDKQIVAPNDHVEIRSYLSSTALNIAIEESVIVISRSGYTSIMDLIKLGQNAILVPTPGQKEQEYLAEVLMQQQLFYCADQDNFSLEKVLAAVNKFSFNKIAVDQEIYKKTIKEFVETIVA